MIIMKKRLIMLSSLVLTALIIGGCTNDNSETEVLGNDPQAKEYWYDGQAELTSYTLSQARYGEIHEGHAVLIFVTEPFSKSTWTKADNPGSDDIPVMKLNFTKKFNTGIYPYSMMNSTFFPFENGNHSLKISSSSQEWCGHTYMELRNKKKFEVRTDSYFQEESNEQETLDKTWLEDDFWTMIRLNPDKLPTGNTQVIPSFLYLRLGHGELKAYDCEIKLEAHEGYKSYTISYPEIERTITITFESNFPYLITGWEETYYSGWGASRQKLTSKAVLNKSLKTDYWTKNKASDSVWREKLGLD